MPLLSPLQGRKQWSIGRFVQCFYSLRHDLIKRVGFVNKGVKSGEKQYELSNMTNNNLFFFFNRDENLLVYRVSGIIEKSTSFDSECV